MKMTTDVATYLAQGCGRCKLGGTPDCKVHSWSDELRALRAIALESGLEETSKWGVPCYTHKGQNVAIVSAFKSYCSVSFFKGILLQDEHKLLVKQGKNTHESRTMKFTNLQEIIQRKPLLLAYLREAAMIEEAKIPLPKREQTEHPMPEELLEVFQKDGIYKTAFEALTPGRQRSYLIHFTGAKQSQTRTNRIEKCREKVLRGKGFNEY